MNRQRPQVTRFRIFKGYVNPANLAQQHPDGVDTISLPKDEPFLITAYVLWDGGVSSWPVALSLGKRNQIAASGTVKFTTPTHQQFIRVTVPGVDFGDDGMAVFPVRIWLAGDLVAEQEMTVQKS
jgi:hypothetical protein